MFAALLAAVILMPGCGDDGGGVVDLTGRWDFYSTPDGGAETGPEPLLIAQTGSAFTVNAPTGWGAGTVSGGSVGFSTDNPVMIVVAYTGTASATHMEGTWENSTFSTTGTWRADLASRACVDVTGIWDDNWSLTGGGLLGTAVADLTMAGDGSITGDYTPGYEAVPFPATGNVYGYQVTLVVDESGGTYDRIITLVGTVDDTGAAMTALGTWSDTQGNGGDWDGTRRP
jgi:hypothetical protein